jgi:hypothetical protein
MNPLLILGGLGAIALYIYSQKSPASGAASTNAGLIAANAGLQNLPLPTAPYDPSNPATYGGPGTPSTAIPPDSGPPVVQNTAPPGAPAGATTSGPLFHTGFSDAMTGAPIVHDSYGNPYLMG